MQMNFRSVLHKLGTFVPAEAVFVLIPGGLGLSSAGLRPLGEALEKRGASVVLVDPPGTAAAAKLPEVTFRALGQDLAGALATLNRPLVLVGHSFGAYLGMELLGSPALTVRGIAALNVPLSEKSWAQVQKSAGQRRTNASARAEENFLNAPTDENFRAWFLQLAPYYFSQGFLKKGEAFLAAEPLSGELFVGTVSAITEFTDERFLALPPTLKKLAVGAEYDALIAVDNLRSDAQQLQLEFALIPGAGHFAPLEAPEVVAGILMNWRASF